MLSTQRDNITRPPMIRMELYANQEEAVILGTGVLVAV
jgi:hypothetical protein